MPKQIGLCLEAKGKMLNKYTNTQRNTTRGMASATSATKSRPTTKRMTLSPEERYRMIQEAAYFIAERRGFCGGCPTADWYQAEEEIDRMLGLR